jgi:DNA-binding protein YbaB
MRAPAPEDDEDFLAGYLSRNRQLVRDLREARAAVRAAEGRAASDDELIEATADGTGTLTRLRIDPRALRLGEAALGAKVTAVLRAAQEDGARRGREIADEVSGRVSALPAPLDETFVRRRVEQVARDLL